MRPDHDDHPPIQQSDGHEAHFSIVTPVVLYRQVGPRKDLVCPREVQSSLVQRLEALIRIENNINYCYYEK